MDITPSEQCLKIIDFSCELRGGYIRMRAN